MQLTNESYFSREAEQIYMGSTQFKRFLSCESQALAYVHGEIVNEPSTAMLIGSYVDAYFSGELPLFEAQHGEIFKKDGSLKSEYKHAEYIIQRIERDPEFMKAMSGQKQVIMTGEIAGVPFKIKVDSLHENRIVDLKIMRDVEEAYDKEAGYKIEWWKRWSYEIQGAIYREVVRQNTGNILPFVIYCATKEKPEPDISITVFTKQRLNDALEMVKQEAPYFDLLKKGVGEPECCGKCPHCRSAKVLPDWREVEMC